MSYDPTAKAKHAQGKAPNMCQLIGMVIKMIWMALMSLIRGLLSLVIVVLTEVRGIFGPAAMAKPAQGEPDDSITNTYQLFAKFLELKGRDADGNTVNNYESMVKFKLYLESKGIASDRSAIIVMAVADKANTLFHGVCDSNVVDSGEDEM